jgi:hypothetical protein
MRVVDRAEPTAHVVARVRLPVAAGLRTVERRLEATRACLRQATGETTIRAAEWLLTTVDSDVADLAASPDVDDATADRLMAMRDALGGYLLAALAISHAGGSVASRAGLLVRATERAMADIGRVAATAIY